MWSQLAPGLVTAGLALVGVVVGAGLNAWAARFADTRRWAAEDERRWLADRRSLYAKYLTLSLAMLEELDALVVSLSYDGTKPATEEDAALTRAGLTEYFMRWERELQPALAELQLLASPAVADLADRVSSALMEGTGAVETQRTYLEAWPVWSAARDLTGEMLDAMRAELGLSEPLNMTRARTGNWPWEPDSALTSEAKQRRLRLPLARRSGRGSLPGASGSSPASGR